MTIETRYRLALLDLTSVSIECNACGATNVLKAEAWTIASIGGHAQCPHCNGLWLTPHTAEHRAVMALTQGFNTTRALVEKGLLPFTIRLEIVRPTPPEK